MNKDAILQKITNDVQNIYKNALHELPYHGWHHIEFVHQQALRFAPELGADPFLVAIAALIHDLNYVVDANSTFHAGSSMRVELLRNNGFDEEIVQQVEQIIQQGDRTLRTADISPEAKALSDADTLFICLPITPIIFTKGFLIERSISIRKIADLIINTQKPLFEQDIFFYSDTAKKYMNWAKTNFELWGNVIEFLDDKEIFLNISDIK